MKPLFLFGVSAGEVFLIFLVILMLFGAKKIPELARSLGKGMNEFKKAADDLKQEFQESTDGITDDLKIIENEIKQNSNEIRDIAQDFYKENINS